MAKRKKAKVARRATSKKAKTAAKRGKSARNVAKTRAKAKPRAKMHSAPRKRMAAKATRVAQPYETVIVDTVEEPSPGVVVVTEYEGLIRNNR
jgi:hypothetical protein